MARNLYCQSKCLDVRDNVKIEIGVKKSPSLLGVNNFISSTLRRLSLLDWSFIGRDDQSH